MTDHPQQRVKARGRFATTHWSVVLAAAKISDEGGRAALAQLCEAYWYPLYAYVRRRGYRADDAQDLTQAFFEQLLEKRSLRVADPKRGRFRSFLLASLNHFLANEFDRAQAQKRGDGRVHTSFDMSAGESRLEVEPSHEETPERLYERQWALALLDVVVRRLEAEYEADGKVEQFEHLRGCLTGDRERLPYAALADALETSEANVRQWTHRLRKRYRSLLREEVGRTLDEGEDIDTELSALFAALA